jgi:hypothetical protein
MVRQGGTMRFFLPVIIFQLAVIHPSFADQTNKINFNVTKASLKASVARVNRFKDMNEFWDKSGFNWDKDFEKIKKSMKGAKPPQMLTIENGFEIVADGKKISVEATDEFGTFLINKTKFTPDLSLGLSDSMKAIEKFIAENPTKSAFLKNLFLSRAEANPVLIGAGIGLALYGIVIALGAGLACLNDIAGKPYPNKTTGEACSDAAKNVFDFGFGGPLSLLAGAGTDLKDWASSLLTKTEIVCRENGSFDVFPIERAVKKDRIIGFENSSRTLELWTTQLYMNGDVAGQLHKNASTGLSKMDDGEKIAKMIANTLNKEVTNISSECKKNPGIKYAWTKTRLEKTGSEAVGDMRKKAK